VKYTSTGAQKVLRAKLSFKRDARRPNQLASFPAIFLLSFAGKATGYDSYDLIYQPDFPRLRSGRTTDVLLARTR
jgi:hypothetical protein